MMDKWNQIENLGTRDASIIDITDDISEDEVDEEIGSVLKFRTV